MSNDSNGGAITPNVNGVNSQKSVEELQKELETLRAHSEKLLSEKKSVSEKLKSFEQIAKEKEEKELKEKEDYKTLVQLREQELDKYKKDLEQERTQRIQGMKLDAFLSAGGNVDAKYWGMIDLEKVAVNPETQQIDQMSVAKLVEDFKKTYPELIKIGNPQSTPAQAPVSGEILTYDKWLTLPLKEQKARYSEMRSNDKSN